MGDIPGRKKVVVSGVQLQVQESPTEPRTVAAATTDAGGEFTYEVPPGPNRRLLLGYRHDSFQVAKTLEIDSHAIADDHRAAALLVAVAVLVAALSGFAGAAPGRTIVRKVVVRQGEVHKGQIAPGASRPVRSTAARSASRQW